MAKQEQLDILKQGVEIWNQWRKEHPNILPDLKFANLNGANLRDADLHQADLFQANLSVANLEKADLREADLRETNLIGANLREADLCKAALNGAILHAANLIGANLSEADLSEVDLSAADLSGANLRKATLHRVRLVETNFTKAILTDCDIYGIAAWNVKLDGARQNNLVITNYNEPTITVDNLKIAQFIYLLLNNAEIREVIDTIAKKAVLILGRFTPERKAVLDVLREALRTNGYLPILFDFEKPGTAPVSGEKGGNA